MKKYLILILLFICVAINAQNEKYFMSKWHESSIEKSGIPAEDYSFSKKGGLYYSLSNDNVNIYIDMKIDDPKIHSRILKEGVMIWINLDNKQLKKTGLRFPVGSLYFDEEKESRIPAFKANSAKGNITPLSLADRIELIGFTDGEENSIPADNTDNFRGSVRYDNEGLMQYNLILPIAKLPVRNAKDGNGAMAFTIGIEYGALPQVEEQKVNLASGRDFGPPPGGVRSRSSRGSGSGGGAQARPGQSNNSGPETAPSVTQWIKEIKLATER